MSSLLNLAGIPNLSTSSALRKLVEVFRESRQDPSQPAPYVTLFLKSGLSMRGQVLAHSDDLPDSILFLLHDPNKPEPSDVTYIMVEEIAAVTIHGAMAVVEHLSDGRLLRPSGPPPALPDLKNYLRTLIDEINQMTEGAMVGDLSQIPVQASPDVLNALYVNIRDLGAVLKKLASEELGRQALREKGFQFFFTIGEEARTHFDQAKVTITIGQGPAGVERVSRESLRSNVEEFL